MSLTPLQEVLYTGRCDKPGHADNTTHAGRMAFTVAGIFTFLLPAVLGYGYMYEFQDTARQSFSIGDDVTLTCPVTLCEGEEYKSVEWIFWSCGRHHFKNYCYSRLSNKVPADRTVKPTVTIKGISCNQEGYYHCKVEGTKGTKREHRIDVYVFRNASAEPRLVPALISLHESSTGPMQITCLDDAHTPGSSIRMYYGTWSWRAAFFEVPTKCTIDYQPTSCKEEAFCSGTFDKTSLVRHQTLLNSVHCDITRPGGKRVAVYTRVQVQRGPG